MAVPKIEERTLYPPLIAYLKSIGFDAHGETKVTTTHPDILFKIGTISFVVEVKIGKPEIGLKAVAQASDYAKKLGTNNIVILIYPEKFRNQVLLDSKFLDQIALNKKINAGIYTKFWTEAVEDTTENIFNTLKEKILTETVTVDFKTIIDHIENYITDLNAIVYQISTDELASEVVNKLDLFSSIGEIKDKEVAQKQVINLASYLLLNQILFYHIFRERTGRNIPELQEVATVREIQRYFDEITKIDYQSIYRVNILGHIPENHHVLNTLNEVIKAIKVLRVEYIKEDLAGRFFHDLIPFEVRKVLAAFYTHPASAELLAGLTIGSWNETVLDPACGSGTLLVSAYKRKMRLYQKLHGFQKLNEIHKKFLENDITGIDIMPFAAHITTLNLASQDMEQETNTVRIATIDSLSLSDVMKTKKFKEEGHRISSYTREIQKSIDQSQSDTLIRKDGSVSLKGKGQGFMLTPVETVIMNPPFSDREKMPEDMRINLKENETLTKICGNQINLWGFFIALTDLILKDNGKMGAVLPINIGRGEATEEIRDYLLKNYRIKYIVKAVKDLAFSEGSQFRDILLIAEKAKPRDDDIIGIVFLKKSIRKITLEESCKIAEKIRDVPCQKGISRNEDFDIYFETYDEFREFKDNLMPILGASNVDSIIAFQSFLRLLKLRGKTKLVRLEKQVDMENLVMEGFHASPAGLSQLTFITRETSTDRTKRAFLILKKEEENSIEVTIKDSNLKFQIPKSSLLPALRTLTSANSFYVDKNKDYFVKEEFKGFESLLTFSKWKDKKGVNWDSIRKEASEKATNLALARRFRPNSVNTHFYAFVSDQKFIVSDTFKVVKVPIEECKLQTLYLNSVVGMMNVVTFREQTTEGFTDIRDSEISCFITLDSKRLSEKDLKRLNELFEELKEVEFPSIVEQLEKRHWARLKLDETVLSIIGFSNEEINEWLPKVYDALARELKAI
ncbi:MAG: N-6 DNA methylase [Candidatus Bathyarchaeia archaeon]